MIKYQTQLFDFPSILAPYEVSKDEIIEIQDESKGIMIFKVLSIKGNELYLEEISPMLVKVNKQ